MWSSSQPLCQFSYEYSYITRGNSDPQKSGSSLSDSSNVDSFCFFEYNNDKYFAIGDHSGRLSVFNYFSGVILKSVTIKSCATGQLRAKKFAMFLKEVIEETEEKIKRVNKARLSRGIISLQKTGQVIDTTPILKENNIIDDYTAEAKKKEEIDAELASLTNEMDELKKMHQDLQIQFKQLTPSTEYILLTTAENYIKEVFEKYNFDCESKMISSGAIGDVVFLDGVLCVAFRKDLHKISFTEFIENQQDEWIVKEGSNTVHDGMIKKIHIIDNILVTIANDKKIALWTIQNEMPLCIILRESDDYYKTSEVITYNNQNYLFISRQNEIHVFLMDTQNPTNSHFLQKLEVNGKSIHEDDVDIIAQTSQNRILTASCEGRVVIWDLKSLTFSQLIHLISHNTDQKKLYNISAMVSVLESNGITHYLTFGQWIVALEEKNGVFSDISPKRNEDVFQQPYGKYSVDVTHILTIGNIVLVVTAESGTIYIHMKNKKPRGRDELVFIESINLNGKITAVHMLDIDEGSFIVTINDGTVLMLKDSAKEMKRRQTLFLAEMQGF
ncbi:hypothetical protein EIN_224240 [Entamoeba invadens IP1]|uniref:Uncharacterized protein n=1 Tax=Entamoeba invadens IP1 TaxID=370355 RepID=A0A0A1U283_ENTIV|nr:hypothetical protein EIN_224240 [Entamoeba invadens IP1]ELP88181.1 hypothetical protein EIN_224240 [Entamoeba invadens IP1]|eukprot:XP_004254952.1 hypothetical protein EIN_224240 [Entamoeba invadens IP1]